MTEGPPPGPGPASPVALVSAYFWPEQLGCAPFMTDLALGLSAAGHPVTVHAAEPHYPRKSAFASWPPPPAGLERLAVRRRLRVRDRSSGGIGVRLFNDVAFALQAGLSLALARPPRAAAVLALAAPSLAVPAARLARGRGRRLVAAVYDVQSGLALGTGLVRRRGLGRLLEAVEAWCLNRADAAVVLTPAMRDALLAIGVRVPIEVVPLWATVEPAAGGRRPDGPPTVMYSGGLSRRHGIEILPEFWVALAGTVPGCRLVVQGDGVERDRIAARLRAVGGPLELRPPAPAACLARSLAEADLQLVLQAGAAAAFAVPSKAVTTLAAGVPFLTDAATGSALAGFAAASGGGLAVPGGSGRALAAAAAALLADPDRLPRMAARGLAHVRAEHGRERTVRAYADLLFPAAAARGAAAGAPGPPPVARAAAAAAP